MSLERVAVLLMCVCVATGDVIASTTTEAVNTTTATVAISEALNFDEFIANWSAPTPSNESADSPQHATDSYLENRLYDSLYYHNYDKAIELSKDIVKQDRSHIIKSLVDYMINERKSEVTAYAYKLWEAKGGIVVEKLFPAEFEMVFNDSLVILTHYWFHVPIELGFRVDEYDDKYVYGTANAKHMETLWKIEPAYVENKIYFKIRHKEDGRYLKLAVNTDRDGHYLAYGSPDSDSEKHLWMLQPVRHDGIILFFLVNRHHYQALTLANNAYDGSRKGFGARGDFYNHPQWYGWRVKILKVGGFGVRIA